ncbi:MAG: TonB-dependent receptor [Bacteroidales bacterium]|nr:TonB-dependent receptor [Bacteroidales bacterium]
MKKTKFLKKVSFRFKRFENKPYSAYNSMHKAVTIGVVSIMTLTFANATKTSAQVTIAQQEEYASEKTLDGFTLTEDALPNQTGKIVTIITSKEIENLHVQSVNELLSTISSIDVQTRGTHGVQSDISFRGGNFDQTAVLIDGINISNPHTGHYSMDIPINIQDIERIEIIKGPSAIIYGASAFSGGINIITKKGLDKGISLSAEAGEHGFANIESSVAYRVKNVENYLSLGFKNSEGYIKNSAYDMYNVLYRNKINLKHDNSLSFNLGFNSKDYDANTFYSAKFPNQHDKTSSVLASLKGLFNPCNNLQIIPSAYYNLHTDEFELIKNSGSANYHRSDVLGNNINIKYFYNNFSFNFGSDTRYESILSSVLGTPTTFVHSEHYNHSQERINFSYFAQANYLYKKFMATVGVISFQNTMIKQKPFNFYPSVNLSYRVNRKFDVFASFNTSSRLPSFTELYYEDAVHQANHELKQEKSLSYEAGFNYKNHLLQVNVSAYYSQGKNLIDWMKTDAQQTKWVSRNINELNKYGIDVCGRVNMEEVLSFLDKNSVLTVSYSWMNSVKANDTYISQYAFNFLKHKFNFSLSLPFLQRFVFNLSGKYCVREGSFIDYSKNSNGEKADYDPYFTMDANLQYKLNNMFSFFVSAANLFDIDYYDIGNIPQSGRWITGGVKFDL